MVEHFIELAKAHYHLLAIGTFVFAAFILLLKLAFKKPNKKALRIFAGVNKINFKARRFQEKRLWKDPAPRIYEHIKIELYSVEDEKFTYYTLSDRKTLIMADVKLEEPLQIRFKYKDGLFWTAWSEKIKKTIKGPPFQLEVYEESQENQQQPDNNQPIETEDTFYRNLCDDARRRINNSENVNIRLMGRIGTGKSSLINTLFYAFTSAWEVKAAAYGQNGSVTRKVTKYELVPGRVNIVDMPGWQNDSGFQIMGEIINGAYDGMEPEMQQASEKLKVNQTPVQNLGSRSKQKNAIIFVVAAEDAEEEDNVNKKILEQLIQEGYPTFVVVTKVDKLSEDGEPVINHKNFYSDPRVIDCCNQLKSIGVNYILPLIKYNANEPIKPQLDYVALHALVQAIGLARD